MGYQSNMVSSRSRKQASKLVEKRLLEPTSKGAFGSLDFRVKPGTKSWNEYESEGIQPQDAPHIACFGDVLGEYFENPIYSKLKVFEGALPKWVFGPDMLVAKWVYSSQALPVVEGEEAGFNRRLERFIKKHKLPETIRPGVVDFELPYMRASFHGFDVDEGVLIHVADRKVPENDPNYWLWQLTAMSYRASMLRLCGFEVKRVVFGDTKNFRDLSGKRLNGFMKLGSGITHLLQLSYDEFVTNQEEPPLT